jgi:hypothetical protein
VTRITTALPAMVLLAACVPDPTVSNAIDALGPEASGVRRGPLHRPGQPCLLCHDGSLGDPPEFTVAGTVYTDPVTMGAATTATVTCTDALGSVYPTTTNAAGNFYVTPDEWNPTFPLTVTVSGGTFGTLTMQSEVGRSGGCATCHVSPAGQTSPGPVVLATASGEIPP